MYKFQHSVNLCSSKKISEVCSHVYFIYGWCYVYLTWLKWADLVGLVMINYSFCHHWLEKKKNQTFPGLYLSEFWSFHRCIEPKQTHKRGKEKRFFEKSRYPTKNQIADCCCLALGHYIIFFFLLTLSSFFGSGGRKKSSQKHLV